MKPTAVNIKIEHTALVTTITGVQYRVPLDYGDVDKEWYLKFNNWENAVHQCGSVLTDYEDAVFYVGIPYKKTHTPFSGSTPYYGLGKVLASCRDRDELAHPDGLMFIRGYRCYAVAGILAHTENLLTTTGCLDAPL